MNHVRHSNIFDASTTEVDLVGAGGIGAATALCLAKMGVAFINLIDKDFVAPENLATQMHRLSDVGTAKAAAVKDMLSEFSDDTVVEPWNNVVDAASTFDSYIVISAVDSIQARKDIWTAFCNSPHARFYLDARMSAEVFHLYVVDKRNQKAVEQYGAMLENESDDNVAEIACTEKATIFCAFIAAGMIGEAVKRIIVRDENPFVQVFDIKQANLFTA